MNIVEIEPDFLTIEDIKLPEFKISEPYDDERNEELSSTRRSANFGGGIELLMNEKNKGDKKFSSSIDIEDITNLENELNELSENTNSASVITQNNDMNKINIDSDNSATNTNKEIKYKQESGSSQKKSIFGDLFGGSKNDGANIKPVTKNNDSDNINLGKSTANMNENKT
jgi:hypothetical protein